MSMDKSLKSHGELERHRNVLTRAERVATLTEMGKLEEDKPVFGLPKVAHRKVKKAKAEAAAPAAGAEAVVAAGAEGAAAAPAAGAKAPAAGAKAPAAGAKAPAAAKAPAGKK